MNWNIVINQQPSLPTSERSAPETKTEDQKRVEAARRGQENYIKKLKEKLLKNNVEAQTTLKEFIEYFQQNLNDPASTLMAIEETTSIIKEEHNTEINISIKRDWPFSCPLGYLLFTQKFTRKFVLYI